MDHFSYLEGGNAYCEDVSLERIAAVVGTPTYVYSRATLERHCQQLIRAFVGHPTLACFAVKANSNLSILKTIFAAGFGADVVSRGELERALLAGVKPERIVYSGVGKREDEIERALAVGILSFNVESAEELSLIRTIAQRRGVKAPVSLRINPNIDAQTNPKIATGLYSTKFGIAEDTARELLDTLSGDPNINVVGLACHIGSQIVDLAPLREAAARMGALCRAVLADGHPLKLVNMGGGLGIRYLNETPPTLEAYAQALIENLASTGLRIVIEPGRVLVGNMGVLLTRVQGIKKTPHKNFLIVDAAMNDLVRPSLYGAYHDILPAKERQAASVPFDVVGPVCETGDFLGLDRTLASPAPGDLMFVRGCGAYGSTMSSNYNSRPRAAEVLVDGGEFKVVRRREALEQLWADELLD